MIKRRGFFGALLPGNPLFLSRGILFFFPGESSFSFPGNLLFLSRVSFVSKSFVSKSFLQKQIVARIISSCSVEYSLADYADYANFQGCHKFR